MNVDDEIRQLSDSYEMQEKIEKWQALIKETIVTNIEELGEFKDGTLYVREGTERFCVNSFQRFPHDIIKIVFPSTLREVHRLSLTDMGINFNWVITDKMFSFLKYLDFSACTQPYKISRGAFKDFGNLQQVIFGVNVEEIEDYAFAGCSALGKVDKVLSIKSLGNYVFSGCHGLSRIPSLPKLRVIPEGTFAKCHALREIKIEDNIETLRNLAFAHCKNLSEVEVGPKLKSKDDSAFAGCIELRKVIIPDNITFKFFSPSFCKLLDGVDAKFTQLPVKINFLGQDWVWKDFVKLIGLESIGSHSLNDLVKEAMLLSFPDEAVLDGAELELNETDYALL